MNIQPATAEPVLKRIVANLDLYDEDYRFKCRNNFIYFRQHIRPKMIWGWWNEVVATLPLSYSI